MSQVPRETIEFLSLSREAVGTLSTMIGAVILLLIMIWGFSRCAEKNEKY